MYTISKRTILIFFLGLFLLTMVIILLFLISGKRDVSITSSPNQAKYKIDNQKEGETPTIVRLPPGKHSIEISKLGFDTIKTDFQVLYFKNNTINYSLTKFVLKKGDTPTTSEQRQETMNDYYKNFPYARLLPYQGQTFYINRPSNDGIFNVYIFSDNAAQSKQDTYGWFKEHGVTNPQGLKINWKYSSN